MAQFLGAFLAALVVRWNYTEALNKVDPGLTIKTQGVFSTLPGHGSMDVEVLGCRSSLISAQQRAQDGFPPAPVPNR